jgi:hypothetical protein
MRDKSRLLRRIADLETRHRREHSPLDRMSREELFAEVCKFVAKIRVLPAPAILENASYIASTLGDWDKVRPQFAASTTRRNSFTLRSGYRCCSMSRSRTKRRPPGCWREWAAVIRY